MEVDLAKAWHLVSHPDGVATLDNFELREVPISPIVEGMVHVRNHWMSVDPYMRGRMNPGDSYITPFELDAPLEGTAVGEVVASGAAALRPGDLVLHMLGWRDEVVAPATEFEKLPDFSVPTQSWLGLMHITGATAYFGLLDVAQAKAADVVFVSAAAGAVGSAVVQIAKVKGMTVIGSAGGQAKCELVRELGADHVIDYKADGTMIDKLHAAAPGGIDIYFDNVGGDHLDAAVANAKDGAKFALCGMIGEYDQSDPIPLRDPMAIVRRTLTLRGFLLGEFMDELPRFRADMAAWIDTGKVRSIETIVEGLENAPEAFLGLFRGANTGKMLVRI